VSHWIPEEVPDLVVERVLEHVAHDGQATAAS
jgi:hypothetical protein